MTLISINELIDAKENISPLFPMEIMATPAHRFDLSKDTMAAARIDSRNPDALERHIQETLRSKKRLWGFGGWGEHREFHSSPDGEASHKAIHLGLDIWLPVGTPLFAPFMGTIHSIQDSAAKKENGPTIITEHTIGDSVFWILFANLSRDSLSGVSVGKLVRSGDTIARVGAKSENGGWPPHVHVQIITNVSDHIGHFPQYAKKADKDRYLELCPNPESLIAPFLVAKAL